MDDIPVGLTLSLRFWYPDPEFKTFTSNRVFTDSVLNLWIPAELVSVAIPIVLIPAIPDIASLSVLKILIVVGLTTLTKYGSPSDNVPVIVFWLLYALPIPREELPSFL